MSKLKINVLTVKLTVHIPVNWAGRSTIDDAVDQAAAILAACKGYGQASMPEPHISRIPTPEPAADPLDIPDGLRRTSEPAAAE